MAGCRIFAAVTSFEMQLRLLQLWSIPTLIVGHSGFPWSLCANEATTIGLQVRGEPSC